MRDLRGVCDMRLLVVAASAAFRLLVDKVVAIAFLVVKTVSYDMLSTWATAEDILRWMLGEFLVLLIATSI